MNGEFLSVALLGALGVLLVAAAFTDLRNRTIANELTGAIALLAPLFWLASGLSFWPEMAMQIAVAGALLALFAVAFVLGQMGGGDVKLLAALALWLPLFSLGRMLVVLAIAGALLTLLMVALYFRKNFPRPSRGSAWRRAGITLARARRGRHPVETPYGVAISFAGLWALTERYLYQSA